jgi:hypothetical protein
MRPMKLVIVMTAKTGKSREAMGILKSLSEYVSKKYDQKGEVFLQLYGVAGTLYVISDYSDVASSQAMMAKIMADDGYWAIANKLDEMLTAPPTITLLQPI